MERVKIKKDKSGGNYLPPKSSNKFISTGCALLDCVLGGGWALGRVGNTVGDTSVGKTLAMIEAAANFAMQYPKGKIWYREAEAAFDVGYAESVGLPEKRVDFGPDGIDTLWNTIEDIWEDLEHQIDYCKSKKVPGLYIVDSLDALSSRAELARKVGQPTFGGEKAKAISEMFRRNVRGLREANIHLNIVSQVRDKIGWTVGPKVTRSGGKALNFYATHILWLTRLKDIVQTVRGLKRPYGVLVRADGRKNKIAAPHRACEFVLRFGFGIDDLDASLKFLEQQKQLNLIGMTASKVDDFFDDVMGLPPSEYRSELNRVSAAVLQAWNEVEHESQPRRRKYE